MDDTKMAADLAMAEETLRAGGVVAFPTETVYGLGADAMNGSAVRRVFAIKGRPADHPLIVHLARTAWLDDWARQIPELAWLLARAFWPGPLTLVLPRHSWVSDAVTGGQDSVALRVPAHPLAMDLIDAVGALVAPSANRFGRISPTTAAHVRAELGAAVDMILDGGPCTFGVESTIVSLLGKAPVLLRPGGISPQQIEEVMGMPIALHGSGVRAPGLLPAHYAPATPLELLPGNAITVRAASLAERGFRVAALLLGEGEGALPAAIHRVGMPTEATAYARVLYATLRALDSEGYDSLLVQAPPDTPDWLAVADRLGRAARAFAAK